MSEDAPPKRRRRSSDQGVASKRHRSSRTPSNERNQTTTTGGDGVEVLVSPPTSHEPLSQESKWVRKMALMISQWVIELSSDKLAFIRSKEAMLEFSNLTEEPPEKLKDGELITALQTFSRTFATGFQEVSTGTTLTLLLDWGCHFLRLRQKGCAGLDPSYIRTTLDTIRRYLVSSLADPIIAFRLQVNRQEKPRGRLSALGVSLIPDPIGEEGWLALKDLLESLVELINSLSRWELSPLPGMLGVLFVLNDEELQCGDQAVAYHVNCVQELSRKLYQLLLSSETMTLDDLMESLIERVVAIDLPPTVRLPPDKMAPFYGGSTLSVTAPDGSKLHRGTHLIVDLISVASLQQRSTTDGDAVSASTADRDAIRAYGVLPSWRLGTTATNDVVNVWSLRPLKRKWAKLQAVSKVFATQAYTFLLQILSKSKAAFVTSEAQNAVRRRAGLLRTLIEDLGGCLSSPYYPTCPVIFFAMIDSLARLSFHDSAKTPMIFHQCYMELARDTYTLLANLSGQVQEAQTLKKRNGMTKCYCGYGLDQEETCQCIQCGTKVHNACVTGSVQDWQCDSCTLDEKARSGGNKILSEFASRFDPTFDKQLVRKSPTNNASESYTARTFPAHAIDDRWRLLVAIGGSLLSQDPEAKKVLDQMYPFFASLLIEATSEESSSSSSYQTSYEMDDAIETPPPPQAAAKSKGKKKRSKKSVEESPSPRVKNEKSSGEMSAAACQRDLFKFTLVCLSESAELFNLDTQTFALKKLWWYALDLEPSSIGAKFESHRRMLNHVVTGKLFATLSNSAGQIQHVKLGDTLVGSVTEMICSIPGSPAAEVLNSDLRPLYEEFLRSGRTGPTIRRSLLASLHKILVRCCESLWAKAGRMTNHEDLIARSDALGYITSFYPYVKNSEDHSSSTPAMKNFLTLSGTIGNRDERHQLSPKAIASEYRHIVDFIRWLAPITFCREVQNSSLSVRNEAWKLVADCIYVCPLDTGTRPILERLILALPNEDVASVRREMLGTVHRLFFSNEASRYVTHLRGLGMVYEPEEELVLTQEPSIVSEVSSLAPSNDSSASDEKVDPQQWPPVHQFSHLLVCLFIVARRQNVVITDDEGSEIPLFTAVADTPPRPRQTAVTPVRRTHAHRDQAFEEISSILISFFAFCRQLPQTNITKQFQRFSLEVVEALGMVSPQSVLQIVPFAAPYISTVPTSSSGVQLTAQICQLLTSVLKRDSKVLGPVELVRRGPQKSLVRLTRVRGALSRAAVLLLGELLTRVTGDFGTIIPDLISKDISIVAKGTYGNVEAAHQIAQKDSIKEKLKQFHVVLSSPIFALKNLETLKHSLLRIGTVVESLDLVSVIEAEPMSESSNDQQSMTTEAKTPHQLKVQGRQGVEGENLLPIAQVSTWFTIGPNSTLLPLPSSGTHFLITLYDILCDAYLVLAELKTQWEVLKGEADREKVEAILETLDREFGPAVIGCITSIVSRYREFIGSSRLRSILELSLQSASAEQQLAALQLMLKALQVPPEESEAVSPPTIIGMTPINKQTSFGSTPVGGHMTQSRARLTQPLCRHLPVVASHLRDAPVDIPLPILGAVRTPSKTSSSQSYQAQCRLIALDLFAEVIAQGLISASDLFEFVGCCFIAGDRSVEAKTRQLIGKILGSVKDASVVLRRKLPLVVLSAFSMFSNRLSVGFRNEDPDIPCGLRSVNFAECFKPITTWYQDYLTTKVSTRVAFTEGLIAALSKLNNYAEVSECLKRSFPPSALYALPDITQDGRGVKCSANERVLFFVAAYAGFCASLLMAVPWRHHGELREILIASQKIIEPMKYRLSVDPTQMEESSSSSSGEGESDDDLPTIYSEDDLSSESRMIFKLVAAGFVALAALWLKRQLWKAYKVDAESKEMMKKRITNKEGESKPFFFDRYVTENTGQNVVAIFDLVYPMHQYIDDASKLLDAAQKELRHISSATDKDAAIDQASKAIEAVLQKTELVALEELDLSIEELPPED